MALLTRRPTWPSPPGEPPQAGFALVAVTLLVVSMFILASIAIASVGFNQGSTTHVNASAAADGAANAGLAAVIQAIATGNDVCQLSSSSAPDVVTAPNAGTDSYAVSVSYYSSYADPEPSASSVPPPTSLISCSGSSLGAGTSFAGVVVTAVGKSQMGQLSSSETITELLQAVPINANYVLFDSNVLSAASVDLTNFSLNQITTTALVNPGPGEVFADTSIAGPSAGGCQMYGTFVSVGSVTMGDKCVVGGSISANTGVTLSQANVNGKVSVYQGNLVMSNSVISGSATTIGNILMCPVPPSGLCTGLNQGNTTISGDATASGTVTLGTTSEPPPPPNLCNVSANGGKQTVDGCITAGDTDLTGPPYGNIALPTMVSPISAANGGTTAQRSAYAAWTAAGYTVEIEHSCSGQSSALWGDIKNATGPLAIVGACTSDGTANGTPQPLTFSGPGSVAFKHDLAIFSPYGFNFVGGNILQSQAGPTPAQLSLIVPTPTTSYQCSSGNYNIALAGTLPPGAGANPAFVDLFTPCTLSVTTKVPNVYGEAFVGNLSMTQLLQMFYEPFTVPAMSFGVSLVPQERYVTKG